MPGLVHRSQIALREETRRRSKLVLKALPVLLIPVVSALITFLVVKATLQVPLGSADAAPVSHLAAVALIVAAVFCTAMIMLVRLGRPTMSALLLIGVWTLITTLATLRGGVTSIGPALLVIPICAAGLLIDGVASMSLALLATALVAVLAWLEMNGVYVAAPQLPVVSQPFPILELPAFTAGVWTGLYWTVALLTSLLAGDLQRALKRSRDQEQSLRDLSTQLEVRVDAQTAELARRARRAEALYEVSQALTSTLDLGQILALIAEQGVRLLSFDSARVLLQEADGRFTSLGAYGQALDINVDMATLEPLLRAVGEQRRPRLTALPTSAGERAVAALMLPMHYGSDLAGVLMLTKDGPYNACSDDDLILAQGLADQAIVAIANARLLNQAREAATLEERTRLARDIHDTLAQGLTGVIVQLGATQRSLAHRPNEAGEHLDLALRMARESLNEARRSVWNLRAPALEGGNLATALKSLTLRPLGANVPVHFEQHGEPRDLPSAVEGTLLRVCQEALANVAKHAQASEAAVVLEYGGEGVSLRVQDNGIGVDEDALYDGMPAGPWSGFGLVGMRERIIGLGGELRISNQAGTRIEAAIPYADSNGGHDPLMQTPVTVEEARR